MDAQVASPPHRDDDPEILEGVIVDDEDQVIRAAVAILSSARTSNGGGTTSPISMDRLRDEVLQLFAQADASPELPSIIAGIGNLYENGYDAAAEHMEMAHWGLPHRLRAAG